MIYKKDKLINVATNKKEVIASSFNNESEYLAFLLIKAKKLSNALYMVMALVSDKEPVKWHLREQAGVLVSRTILLRTTTITEKEFIFEQISSVVLETMTFLEIMADNNLVSEMNFKILQKEYQYLLGSIKEREEVKCLTGEFIKDLLGQEEDTEDFHKGQNVVKDTVYKRHQGQYLPKESGVTPKKNIVGSMFSRLESSKINNIEKNNRTKVIIGLFKRGKAMSVKNVSSVVKDCSEKTIQRELVFLVNQGILRKEGEKRWSQYFLA